MQGDAGKRRASDGLCPAGNVVVWALTALFAAALLWTALAWSHEATQCLASGDAFLQCYPELEQRI